MESGNGKLTVPAANKTLLFLTQAMLDWPMEGLSSRGNAQNAAKS